MLYDNDASARKTEADVQWADFQERTTRQGLSELAIDIVPEARRSHYQELARLHAVDVQEIKSEPSGSFAE